uniref:Uncharacterized protein n=1 Tax=Lepeophtheirus salmonis TaxID=72036 RepID=A0A0K2UC93_LEPSM
MQIAALFCAKHKSTEIPNLT